MGKKEEEEEEEEDQEGLLTVNEEWQKVGKHSRSFLFGMKSVHGKHAHRELQRTVRCDGQWVAPSAWDSAQGLTGEARTPCVSLALSRRLSCSLAAVSQPVSERLDCA